MASMEDLIATMSGDLHAGRRGDDLRDLHSKLSSTIQQAPTYRTPSNTTHVGPAPHSTGPLPPPAPVSSWNSPPPAGGFLGASPSFAAQLNSRLDRNGAGHAGANGLGTTPPRQQPFPASPSGARPARETGFKVSSPGHGYGQGQGQGQLRNGSTGQGAYGGYGPGEERRSERIASRNAPPQAQGQAQAHGGQQYGFGHQPQGDLPAHSAVLPVRASPKDTGGFADDAFKPLWSEQERRAGGGGWGAFR